MRDVSLRPGGGWGELVQTGPDRAQTFSLRLFLYCGLCPRPGRGKVPILTLPDFPPTAQGVIFSSRTDISNSHIPGCPPLAPETQASCPPAQTCSSFWRQEAERAKDLTLSLQLPASLSLRGGQPQLSILERPRQAQKQGTETDNWGWKGQTNKSPSL